MTYDIKPYQDKGCLKVTWQGLLQALHVEAFLNDYARHRHEWGALHIMHDMRDSRVAEVFVDDLMKLSRRAQVFAANMRGLKVAFVVNDDSLEERVKVYTSLRTMQGGDAPDYAVFSNYQQALDWVC